MAYYYCVAVVAILVLNITGYDADKVDCDKDKGACAKRGIRGYAGLGLPPIDDEQFQDMSGDNIPPPLYWPEERYALIMAGNACPGKPRVFKKGFRYQDSEDYCSLNDWTDGMGMEGPLKKDAFKFGYCCKNEKDTGNGYWPEGNYCIHRYGWKCPTGFEQGTITWDDENDTNTNRHWGKLPAGRYDHDTMQYFCCREDGNASIAIPLPPKKPFYLYQFTAQECQQVRRMDVREEFILFDDQDDDNHSNRTGSHPRDDRNSNDHLIHYCHYTPRMVTPA